MQNNVERALANLCPLGALEDPQVILDHDVEKLAQLIGPSGYYNSKARYLHNVAEWYHRQETLLPVPPEQLSTSQLRQHLLAIKGVGEETADDILLYVYHRPVFIYDAYARRLLDAAGWGQAYPLLMEGRFGDVYCSHAE